MKVLLKQRLILCFSSVLLVSCAGVESESDAAAEAERLGSDCISIATIRDYTPLTNRSLLVEAAPRRIYYVELLAATIGLKATSRLGFQSRDGWLCPFGGDEIVFDGVTNDSIRIRSISRLTVEQADELLIQHGKRVPAEQQDPMPPKLEGAEVKELGKNG